MGSLEKLMESAHNGDTEACLKIGHKYAEGDGVQQDYTKAMNYYRIAANQGDADALYSLAYCYMFGLKGDDDHEIGMELMKEAAEKGVAVANEHMGWVYFRNQFAPVDYEKSFSYMKKAADQGDAIAQAHIAQAYEKGIWGAPERNLQISKMYYDLAVEQNNGHALWAVGENYLGGYNGYPLDERKAVEYFSKGAENGSHRAQLSLALCFYNGKGVQKNMSECAKWLKIAAESGNAEAQWRWGYFMIEGIATPKDIENGKHWVEKSASQGEQIAVEMLDELARGQESEKVGNNSNGGCYVATAVYGSYDCPEVWILRRFRDYELAGTWHGRIFIHIYYAISPSIVKWFGKTKWFNYFCRNKLDKLVNKLKKEGFDSSPYEDKMF